jgi:hypothetical protein
MSGPSPYTNPTVYRMFNAGGQLLYVGRTCNIGTRLDVHRRGEWWKEVASITCDHFAHSHLAELAEARARSTTVRCASDRSPSRRSLRRNAPCAS